MKVSQLTMARRGENIHKRKDGRWEGRYISSRLPNGRAKYSSVYGKTYKEVKEKLINKKSNQQPILKKSKEKMLFCELLDVWLKSNMPNKKESTVIKYSNLIEKHILPELGNYQLTNLDASVFNSFLQNKISNGRLDGKGGISISYARTIMIIIKSALDYANAEGICSPISTSNIVVPKVQKSDVTILTEAEQKKLEHFIFSNVNNNTIGIILSLYMGLRKGEICALKWENIDLYRRTINIENSISVVKNKNGTGTHFEIKKPKTESSVRSVPIPNLILPLLKEIKKSSSSEFVVSKNKKFINPRTFEYRFHKEILKCGINDFNFHKLRHTFATRCIEKGMDPKTLSEILGHSSVAITLNLYVHPTMKQKFKQINKLNKQIA